MNRDTAEIRATLYYVYDPMCSWCYAFIPVWKRLQATLPAGVDVRRLLGGLAPDTDEPMPEEMRQRLQQTWQRIEASVPGTRFNFAFWEQCQPQRATYLACRAVLAAREQNPASEEPMAHAIQQAYYQQARNPSEADTLIAIATEIGLDRERFTRQLTSTETEQQLQHEIALTGGLGVDSFPSLVLCIGTSHWPIPIDYTDPQTMLDTIDWLLSEA